MRVKSSYVTNIWGFSRLLGLPVVFIVLTVLLGTVGHLLSIERQAVLLDFADALFGSLRYLVFDGFQAPQERCDDGGSACSGSVAIYLIRASQLCAVIFVLTAAKELWLIANGGIAQRRFFKQAGSGSDIDLIIGVGWHGAALFGANNEEETSSKDTRVTLAIDIAPSGQAEELCRRSGAQLLQANANSSDFWGLFKLGAKSRIFLAAGSDAENAKILRHLARRIENAPRRVKCFVAVSSFNEFEMLLDDVVRKALDIRPFNDAANTVRLLCQSHSEARSFNDEVITSRLVLLGAGTFADALLLHWIQNQIFEDTIRVQIDVVHPEAHSAALAFAARHPCFHVEPDAGDGTTRLAPEPVWLNERILPRIVFHPLPISIRGQIDWVEQHLRTEALGYCNTTVAVMFDDIAKSASVAQAVRPSLLDQYNAVKDLCQLGVWVYLNTLDKDLFNSLEKSLKRGAPEVHVFTDFLGGCSKNQVASDLIERAAMQVHWLYSDVQHSVGPEAEALWYAPLPVENAETGAPTQPQPPRTEWDRESSRLSGAHAWVKRDIAQRLQRLHSTKQEVDAALAQVEHRRWCAVHLLLGWQPLVGRVPESWSVKEKSQATSWYLVSNQKQLFRERKRHICLLPFADLNILDKADQGAGQREQNKDLRIVRENDAIIEYAEKPEASPC